MASSSSDDGRTAGIVSCGVAIALVLGLGTTVLVQRTLSIVTFEPGLAARCRVPHDQHRIGVSGQLDEAA